MINIVIEEAEASMVTSYNEGYKQATLELQPEIEILRYRLDTKESNSFKSYITTASISFGLGCFIGGVSCIGISLKLNN